MSYENHELHQLDDGSIFLYTRNGNLTYHARLKVDGIAGYPKIGSTGKRSAVEAYAVAKRWFDDLRFKSRHGLEVRSHTFLSAWRRWRTATAPSLSPARLRYLEGTANRYLLPFFGDLPLESIDDETVRQYWDWRIHRWSSAEGRELIAQAQKTLPTRNRPYKQTLGNVAKVPAAKTLQMEQTALRQVFNWLQRRKVINRVPEIKAPKSKRGREVGRRPAFDAKEWAKLQNYLLRYTQGKETGKSRIHSLHRWQRRMIRAYVMFMRYSGLRPGEAAKLRWGDIFTVKDRHGEDKIALHVSPETKTGERITIPLFHASVGLHEVLEISTHTKRDDLVFCDQNGKAIKSFGKTFKKILRHTGLLIDRFGRERTIYSLRHTYATLQLLERGTSVEDLAENMGTSPHQIFRHYRHITVQQKADELAGKPKKFDIQGMGEFKAQSIRPKPIADVTGDENHRVGDPNGKPVR